MVANSRRVHRRGMTTHRSTAGLAVVLLAAAFASACGDDGKAASTNTTTAISTAPVEDPESAYCETVRDWMVRQLTPYDPMDPEQLRAFIAEDVNFHHTALAQAPDA